VHSPCIAPGRAVATFLVLSCAAGARAGGRAPVPVLNPLDYASPSGEFTLRIDPSDRHGRGPARCELRRNGKVIWSAEKYFTPRGGGRPPPHRPPGGGLPLLGAR
jgi:hypothetical protein